MSEQIAILGAPSALGLSTYRDGSPRAVDQAPRVLRSLGLADRIGGHDFGDVVPEAPYRDLERPARGVRNAADVAAYNVRIGSRVAEVVALGYFPLLLGGDCSILLGALQGLGERVGDVAVAYLDAHADFGSLEESPSGSACSMNLALAVGRDPEAAGALGPVVEAARVVHIGRRDETDEAYGGAALRDSPILDLPMRQVRAPGPDAALGRALERLTVAPVGYWVHFDVDVLDPSVMPAVDSPLAGGFSSLEATSVLGRLLTHPRALGLQVTIYDPKQDPDRSAGQRLVDLLAAVLPPAALQPPQFFP
ncbi:MAG TPA: arginase family protein [Thermoleophilaceae bacterium]|jgi:arginase|nr:arginase family protein [Thermoleophilaceae bacterium]